MTSRLNEDTLTDMVGRLRSAHGDNLVSVVLYGSAAVHEIADWRTDYNLLVCLRHITPADLRASQGPSRGWTRAGNSLPVYFSVEELNEAADVFPIEFHRMASARKVLFGTDPFHGLQLSQGYLRHQTEYELRSKLIQLRRLYIPASTSAARVSDLMCKSLLSFADLFRAVLLLMGREASPSQMEAIRQTVAALQLDNTPFERLLKLCAQDGESTLSETEADALFADYLTQIEAVITAVDQLAMV